MKVVNDYPPNYAEIVDRFPSARKKGVIFTYGNMIYSPGGIAVSHPLQCHEAVHSSRQGGNPDEWWKKYLSDKTFRYSEELEAHKAEYAAFSGCGRNQRRIALKQIARRLSGPLYGGVVSAKSAEVALKGGL